MEGGGAEGPDPEEEEEGGAEGPRPGGHKIPTSTNHSCS